MVKIGIRKIIFARKYVYANNTFIKCKIMVMVLTKVMMYALSKPIFHFPT